MTQWMRKISDSEAYDIAVAIEVNHGPVVESLCEQGFMVYSINPKQLDRFRDRFCVSGAKERLGACLDAQNGSFSLPPH